MNEEYEGIVTSEENVKDTVIIASDEPKKEAAKIANEESEINQKICKEYIEKKPEKYLKKFVAIMLICTLIIGTAFGFGLYALISHQGGYNLSVKNGSDYLIDKTVSPVVPISEKVLPSIVAIKVKAQMTTIFGNKVEGQGTGSGIIYDNLGHIVTNNHVVEGATDLVVVLNDGTELPAQLVGRDPVTDLAVIKVSQKNLPAAEFGDSDTLQVGELAVALGNPMGTDFAGSVTSGIISGLNRQVSVGDKTMDLIQTDAAINPGNSGGALVNSEGKVIGINVLKLSESTVEGMGFSIPVNEAKTIIEQLINEQKVVRPSLGIEGSTISAEDAKTYNLPQGVYIQGVISSSGAEKAGIKQGDIITEINGQKVLTIEEVIAAVSSHKVGDKVKVTIADKYNKQKIVEVTLGERSQ
jgi:serine protease Do